MIEVEAPDGTILEFPDGTPREVMLQAMRKRYGAPEPTERGMLWPVSKDAEGNLQFDSDAGILGAAKRAFWLPYEAATGQLQMTDPETGRTSDEAIGRSLEAGATVNLVPPAASLGARAATNFPGFSQRLAPKEIPIPTNKELKSAAKAQRLTMSQTGAEYPAEATARLPEFIAQQLRQDNFSFNPKTAPRVHATLDELRAAPEGSISTIDDIVTLRQTLQGIAQDYRDPVEQKAASAAIEGLDSFIRGFGDRAHGLGRSGDRGGALGQASEARQRAAQLLEESNANFAAGFRSELLDGIDYKTGLRAAAANSGQNIGNKYRQNTATALTAPKRLSGFSDAERKAMENVVYGTRAANRARDLGNTLGGGGGLGKLHTGGIGASAGGALGGFLFGPYGAMTGAAIGGSIPPAMGTALKNASNRMTKRAFDKVDEAVRMRSPLYQKRTQVMPGSEIKRDVMTEAVIRALIMSAPPVNAQ